MYTQSDSMTEKAQHDEDVRTLVEVQDLVKHFPVGGGFLHRVQTRVKAVDGVSFKITKGETLGLVGESGCGKTTVGRTMLYLEKPTRGSVFFEKKPICEMRGEELKALRRDMQIIFQDPYSSLDPRMPIGSSVAEGLRIHNIGDARERKEIVVETLRKVGLEDYHIERLPREFSGGQRQRIGIARALAMRPKFIVADEPVSILDVSIQAQILNILKDLQDEYGLTYLFIAHDLSVIEYISDRVAVMYLGKIVELALCKDIYRNPLHPYTQALISAIPVARRGDRATRKLLSGEMPSPLNPPSGCNFHTRCPVAMGHCIFQEPLFQEVAPGHWVSCWYCE